MTYLSVGFGPNQKSVQVGPFSNSVYHLVLDTDGVSPFPHLDPGGRLQGLSIRSVATGGGVADGSNFQVLFNAGIPSGPGPGNVWTAPTGAGYLVDGGPGTDLVLPITPYTIWIKPVSATDLFDVLVFF